MWSLAQSGLTSVSMAAGHSSLSVRERTKGDQEYICDPDVKVRKPKTSNLTGWWILSYDTIFSVSLQADLSHILISMSVIYTLAYSLCPVH